MQHQTPNNSRLLYFAKAAGEGQKTSARLLTQEQERYAKELEDMQGNPHAKELAKQFRKGNIENEIFTQAREVLRDPNKMKDDVYKHFIKALAKGKFPNKSKSAPRFLRALQGSAKEKAYATDVLKDLSSDTVGSLSKYREKEHLKTLTDLRQEAVTEETIKETVAKTGTITASADIRNKLEAASKTAEIAEGNFRFEEFPAEQAEKITALMRQRQEIEEHYEQARQKIVAAESATKVDEVLVKRLKKEIEAIHAEHLKIEQQYQKENQKAIDYIERNAKRADRIKHLETRETGIRLNKKGAKIKIWTPEEDGKGGMLVDSKTGRAMRREGEINVKDITFDTDRSDLEPQAPGSIHISYINERGEEKLESAKNFTNLLNAYGAYEASQTLDELNEAVSDNTGGQALKPGMEFTVREPEVDEFKAEVDHTKTFKIHGIDEKDGTITLDQAIVATPKEWISYSTHPKLYFPRVQRKFKFGEFAKLLGQHQYQTEVSSNHLAEVMKKNNFPPLKDGEEREVWYLDDTGKRREGKLTREGNEYFLEQAKVRRDDYPDYEDLVSAGVPMHIAAAYQSRIPETDKDKKIWKRKKLSARNLLEMTNKNNIAQAQGQQAMAPTQSAQNFPSDTGTEPLAGDMDYMPDTPEGQQQEAPNKEGKPLPKHDEALPYSEIFKVGGMERKERSLIKDIWVKTRFLSGNDLWEMGKAMWEYYQRRFTRRQKEKYSSVGTDLPFFAPEMKRINQAAENEEMNQYKETFAQKGVFEILARLRSTGNRDELKAAFAVLCEKGQMRWDDIDIWKNINRFVDPAVAIPIPSNGDPNTRVSDKDNRTGFDFLKGAIDSMWGEGNYNGWFNQNKSAYQSTARQYYEEGKELEGVEGGHGRRLATLLAQHKRGQFVDPHEYEGLILHAIEAGKARMQAKLYYMIEGVGAVNGEGRTILSFDRMAHINSEMLQRFPLLEYICAPIKRPDGKSHRFTVDDYKRWCSRFDEGDPMNPDKNKPGTAVDKFLWEYVLPSDDTQNRINKVLRNGEMLDHDDMFAYLPPATEQIITDATRSTTGSKKFLTVEGYANAFPGFSQYMRSLAESNNRDKLREAVKSFVRYEGIVTSRFEKDDKGYQRFDWATLNSGTIVTPDRPPQLFINQINGVIEQVIEAYGDPKLSQIYQTLRQETGDIFSDRNEMDKQKLINQAFKDFGKRFNLVIKKDNGTKMTTIIAGANLEGMQFGISDEEMAKRKAEYKDTMQLAA